MVTPVLLDHSAQAKAADGFDKNAFTIDWKSPPGPLPRRPHQHRTGTRSPSTARTPSSIKFSVTDLPRLPLHRASAPPRDRGRRMLTLRPEELHETLARARAEQKTETWKNKYALRAGVEGTINQALDVTGIRRARYRGLPKVRLQHAFSATALNMIRLDA